MMGQAMFISGVWIVMIPTIINSRRRIIQLDLCLACSECCEEVRGTAAQDTLGVPILSAAKPDRCSQRISCVEDVK